MRGNSKYGHVGKVIAVYPERWEMLIMDSNWSEDEKVKQRVVPIYNSNILGYNNVPTQKALNNS